MTEIFIRKLFWERAGIRVQLGINHAVYETIVNGRYIELLPLRLSLHLHEQVIGEYNAAVGYSRFGEHGYHMVLQMVTYNGQMVILVKTGKMGMTFSDLDVFFFLIHW